MKSILRLIPLLTCAIMLCMSPIATADTMEDLSWFGNTGATGAPVKDDTYSGYWWWPTEPGSNVDDSEVWGNRGVIYNMFTPPKPPAPKPPAKPPVKGPAVERSVTIFNDVLFDFDKSVVKTSEVNELKKVVAALKKNSSDTIIVEGHTCDVNSSGDPDYNKKLGQRRANAVAKVLKDNGINKNRVVAVSRGESSPAVPNTSDSNRRKNRRAVLRIQIK